MGEVSEKGEMSIQNSLVEIRNLVIRLQVKMRSKVRRHISLYDSSDLEGMLAVMFSVVAAQKE